MRDLFVTFPPSDLDLHFDACVTLPKRGLMWTLLHKVCAPDTLLLQTERGLYSLHI